MEKRSRVQRLLREPLVHFLILGAGLFVIFGAKRGPALGERDIVVTPGRVEQIAEGFQRVWNRPPTPEELNGLIDDFVLEEIYYREALALGLEEDDTIIRRRLRQKMAFLAENTDVAEPSDADLVSFLEQNPERFRVGERVSLDQVYVSVDKRGDRAEADALELKRRLVAAGDGVDAGPYGDPFLLAGRFESTDVSELDRMFGNHFGSQALGLPIGSWQGPIESGYGLHLVRVRATEEGRLPALEEIRDQVRTAWETARRTESETEFETRLRSGYKVKIEWPDWAQQAATKP